LPGDSQTEQRLIKLLMLSPLTGSMLGVIGSEVDNQYDISEFWA